MKYDVYARKLLIFRATFIVMLMGWMTVIFLLSSQTADVSSKTSGGIITAVVRFFYRKFETLSNADKDALIGSFQFIVRKGAHFTAYAVLGLFSFLSLVTYTKIPLFVRSSISALICLVYSVSDEIHQTFIEGRSGEIRDVCIDVCGSLLAITVLTLIVKRCKLKVLTNGLGGV